MYCRILIVLAALGSTACSRTIARLTPPDGVATAPGGGAMATAAGVRVIARPQAWEWGPANLTTEVTPILVELRNDGTRPVLVRYNHMSLADADGHRFNVMPPYDIDATLTEAYTVRNPVYGFSRFAIAPYLSRWYPRFNRYGGAFGYDASYYSPYITRYRETKLPTIDMVQRALPEGVLEPGGQAMGFIYFEAFHRDAKMLTLSADIVDAASGSIVGTARIPFKAD